MKIYTLLLIIVLNSCASKPEIHKINRHKYSTDYLVPEPYPIRYDEVMQLDDYEEIHGRIKIGKNRTK